jgi:hypothetical protein
MDRADTAQVMFAAASPPRKSNLLAGVAACLGVVGLLALCLPGLMWVSGLALLLGLIAMFRSPRAFAILAIVLAFVGLGLGAAHLVVRGAVDISKRVVGDVAAMTQNNLEATQIATAIETYRATNKGTLPATLRDLQLPLATTLDAWGESYVYEVREKEGVYSLRSNGPDRTSGTSDDLDLTNVASIEPYVRDAVPFASLPPVPPSVSPQAPRTPQQPQPTVPPAQAPPVRTPTPGPA